MAENYSTIYISMHALNIPIRIPTLPTPGIRTHISQRVRGAPAKQLLGQRCIRITLSHITRAARRNLEMHWFATGLLKSAHNLQNAVTLAGAHIHGKAVCALQQGLHCRYVGLGQVLHVDVITHASAVWGARPRG